MSCKRCGYTPPPSSDQAGLKDPNPYQMACQIFKAENMLSWEEAMQKAARRVRKEWKQEKKKAKKKLPNGSDKPVTAKKKKKTTMK